MTQVFFCFSCNNTSAFDTLPEGERKGPRWAKSAT